MNEIFEKAGDASNFLKLLANPNRLAILCCLLEKECNVSELCQAIGIPQAATSNQLAILREAGIIVAEVNHRERVYRIEDEKVKAILGVLYKFYCE
ncbi:metalloregulator ArsR/SmtB family transcription factor [Actinobacillus genomosp. 1]|uniref:ArsR/SmtB family transcription factor n=1 Tax=Actinobacillus genomosp. 1 TaxID=254839 RepID=UPI002443547B|nr:metalloregulator ArsR/SmtB family transcription factor [Actinobacillus genomosp. 1]WGE34484.1 metalloregulator ArsR/SmtB family transcription factor [Actinobacillus genomosp. 1]WGE91877.1 metalloregulator ArsR/SmtB family transcription factor [Actinobacillus genomosp. 1]